jgi:hypothetical protein
MTQILRCRLKVCSSANTHALVYVVVVASNPLGVSHPPQVRAMLAVPYLEKALYELPEDQVGGGRGGCCCLIVLLSWSTDSPHTTHHATNTPKPTILYSYNHNSLPP